MQIVDPVVSSTHAIQVLNLVKKYGDGASATFALKGVTFSIAKGDFVAIIGPSGSGKSTLLNLIGALDRPTSGKVFLDGIDTSKLSNTKLADIRNKKIGFVFQSFNLLSRISVRENVELPLVISGVPSKERRRVAMNLLEQFGIASKSENRPNDLSGGEQQRVAVARALATDPPLILADEPTGNLDTKNTEIMMEELERLHESSGKTIVMITHNTDLARRTRTVIAIRDGEVAEAKKESGS